MGDALILLGFTIAIFCVVLMAIRNWWHKPVTTRLDKMIADNAKKTMESK